MQDNRGVWAAVLSSAFGGTAIVATRYLAGSIDPITIGMLRFTGGFLLLLPITLIRREVWPERAGWPFVAALGLLFFGLFPILFNASLIFTTSARAALALATMPLLTMTVAAVLGIEPLTPRKTLGVLIAMSGVAVALAANLKAAPAGAWRGDLLMIAGALCMAFYSVWSRPFIARSSPIAFTACGMAVGAAGLAILSGLRGGFAELGRLNQTQWLACLYLAVFCAALIFFLWAYALGRTPPTLVAISVAVNPVTASLVGLLLLGEPITINLMLGLAMVLAGILVASGLLRSPVAQGGYLARRKHAKGVDGSP